MNSPELLTRQGLREVLRPYTVTHAPDLTRKVTMHLKEGLDHDLWSWRDKAPTTNQPKTNRLDRKYWSIR